MKVLVALVLVSIFSLSLQAQDALALRKKHFNLSDGLAINGYDPVAYFKQNKAIKGRKELAVFNEGATYYFSSVQNKEDFKRNPSMYEPQYGGWCAYAMGSTGEKVSVDPETFKIVGNRLYLFYNKFFNNTLKSWNKDEKNLNTKADQHWANIFH